MSPVKVAHAHAIRYVSSHTTFPFLSWDCDWIAHLELTFTERYIYTGLWFF